MASTLPTQILATATDPTPTNSPSSSPSTGLSTSDIVAVAVAVPSGVIALLSVIIAFCAWRYPKSPIGKIGKSVQRVVRGGDAHGGHATGSDARGGDAHAGDAFSTEEPMSDSRPRPNLVGGTARGGNSVATGQAVGGSAWGGDAGMAG
ncbi:hypothetical protein F5B17DRAFT_419923 [Nemania serpens]|nr:hypothetical protein F5B17DRAFT_419923 [Nemania serpens]